MIFITKSDLVKNNFLRYQIHTDLVAANNSPVRDNFHWCVSRGERYVQRYTFAFAHH